MNESWFDPTLYAWIPGTVYGTSLGMLGGISGVLACRSKARSIVSVAWWLYLGIAAVFLGIGVVAFFSGQPYGIWYGFGLPGVLGMVLCPTIMPQILAQYRAAEDRRMRAADITESLA